MFLIYSVLLVGSTLFLFYYSLSEADHNAIFREGGLTGSTANLHLDKGRADRFYYLRFFANNMSRTVFLAAMFGFLALLIKEKTRGFLLVSAFWVPLLALSFIGYRQHRFLFFAFPFYVLAFSYGVFSLWQFCCTRKSLGFGIAFMLIVIFFSRLTISGVRLLNDSIVIASGADVSLAKQHPRWRVPCTYVRERLNDETVVIGTDVLPILYYAGKCDNWFPSKVTPWEWVESGMKGLVDTEELKKFLLEHPSGFFLAEHRKFWYIRRFIPEEVEWVAANMTWLKEASNPDISVFAWGQAAK